MTAALNKDLPDSSLPLPVRTLQILMVEDSSADAALIVAVLKRAGYPLSFDAVTTPTELEEQLRAKDYDIVLSDHNLITWTGFDAFDVVRKMGKDIPFVVVTATLGDEAAVEYIKRGAADYVLKHRLEKLPAVIGQTLREQAHRRRERDLLDKLQCGKREWELTFDTVPDGVFLADGECRIRRANQAARELLNLQYSEFIGQPCPEVLGAMSHPISECPHQHQFAAAARPLPLSSNGESATFESSCTPVRDATGALRGCVHVVRDVTEKTKAERAVRESERKYRDLVENTNYGVCRTSPEGRFLDVNPALVAMLGYGSKEEVLALNLATDVYRRPSDRNALLQQYRDGMSHLCEDLAWMKKDGSTLVVQTNGRAVLDDAGQIKYYEAIVEDMTARRTLEAELRQAQKMEAVGRLAGGVAHDFNNLLTVILGNAALLLETFELPNNQKHRIDEIKTAASRAAELTQRLLSFSRKQVLDERVFDLNSVLQEAVKLMKRVLGEDIRLTAKLSPSPLTIRTDQAQLEQSLMNLAVNARDAMPEGGALIIETCEAELDDSYSQGHNSVTSGPYAMLTFSDTGVGMDEEVKNRIFEPFFTTKEPGKGTGLGLAIVYGFIQQTRGLIHVYSEHGKGTTFKIYFPKVAAPEEHLAAVASAPIVGGTETVLVAEDEGALRALAVELLEATGYTVLSASSGSEALERAQLYPNQIDLLLTDVIMPNMSGRELAVRLTSVRPDVKVLYMSGYTNQVVIQHQLLAPHEAFLNKPFTREALASKIRQLLDTQITAPSQDMAMRGSDRG